MEASICSRTYRPTYLTMRIAAQIKWIFTSFWTSRIIKVQCHFKIRWSWIRQLFKLMILIRCWVNEIKLNSCSLQQSLCQLDHRGRVIFLKVKVWVMKLHRETFWMLIWIWSASITTLKWTTMKVTSKRTPWRSSRFSEKRSQIMAKAEMMTQTKENVDKATALASSIHDSWTQR